MISLLFFVSLAMVMVKALGYVDWPWLLTLIPTFVTVATIAIQLVVMRYVLRAQKKMLRDFTADDTDARDDSKAKSKGRW